MSQRAIQLALSAGEKETAADWEATAALREAEFGNREQSRTHARTALKLSSARTVQIAAALAFARNSDKARARALASRLRRLAPSDTLLAAYWLPSIRAAIALDRRDSVRALTELRVTDSYERGGYIPPFSSGATLYPAYLRGQVYLQEKNWTAAEAEFRKILDQRGLVWNFPLEALANLQLARAHAGARSPTAKGNYEEFLSGWALADKDNRLYTQAKREYAELH